jgi:aminopeptidase S
VAGVLRRHLPPRTRTTSLGSGSDHSPFERAGIPVGGIFTGLDSCYHEACDTLRNVDARLTAQAARATAATLRELAARADGAG